MWKFRILVSLVTVSELKDLMVDQKYRRSLTVQAFWLLIAKTLALILSYLKVKNLPLVKNIFSFVSF